MLIVFWLTPVVLLVVLILLTLQIIKRNRASRLYVIEPLGFLVKSWQVARFEPDSQSIRRMFKLLATSNLSEGTMLERIVVSAADSISLKSKGATGTLVERQSFGSLSVRMVLETGNKTRSFLIGPLEQIEGLVSDGAITKYRALSRKSAEHGYLALTVAASFLHGEKRKMNQHQIEGTVVLEPVVDENQLARLRTFGQTQVRFLTLLPIGTATHLYGLTFSAKTPFGLDAKDLETLLPPKFAESDLEKAVVVGGADLIARHQTLRVWQRRFDCVVVSVNPEDRDLPVTPVSHLP